LHEFRIAHADEGPDSSDQRDSAVFNAPQKCFEQTQIEDGLRNHVLGARFHFEFKATNLVIQIGEARISSNADYEASSGADRIAAKIEPAIEVVYDIDESNGVYVKHCGGIGIIPHLWRITRDADEIPNPDSSRAQKITLDAQHISIAACVVQNRINADFALNQQ